MRTAPSSGPAGRRLASEKWLSIALMALMALPSTVWATPMGTAVSGKQVTVHFATANGTALAPGDYTATSGTLIFAAGETTKTITIAVRGDTAHEADESFKVNLSAPVNATISDAVGVVTILNND